VTLSEPDSAQAPAAGQAPEQRKGSSGRWVGLLALLPIACCGLPLLVAAGAAAGTGALLGGAGGVVLLFAASVLAVVTLRRRRRRHDACRTDVDGARGARKGCC